MNLFKKAAIDAVNRNGRILTYTEITRTVDKITGKVIENKVDFPVKMYPRSVKATQYNFPDLIGKEVITFYLAVNSLPFTPKMNDVITKDGKIFTIRFYDFHEAHGENCLYKITGATG